MRIRHLHGWDVTPKEAVALQRRLAGSVETSDRFAPPSLVAGVDVGFESGGAVARAAVAVLRLPGLSPVETAIARRPVGFPYVPGLLSFREIPAVLDALGALAQMPDLILCDGHGRAHPRRFGLACHLGLMLDLPTVGVAKSLLVGSFEPPADARGAWTPLTDGEEVIGAALRSRCATRPIFVSIGHRVGLTSAIALVMACTTRYRLPETTRQADRLTRG